MRCVIPGERCAFRIYRDPGFAVQSQEEENAGSAWEKRGK